MRDKEGLDLAIFGSNDVVLRNGVAFSQGYAQQFRLKETDEGGYQITRFQATIVSRTMAHPNGYVCRKGILTDRCTQHQDSAPLSRAIAAKPFPDQKEVPSS